MMHPLRLVLPALLLSGPGVAQSGAPAAGGARRPPPGRTFFQGTAHYGKWLTAATAVGFTVYAAVEHNHSQQRFDQLLSDCRANHALCALNADGTYVNAATERLYQESLYYDRLARRRLLIGQAAVLVTAAFFIVDFSSEGKPADIPFTPELAIQPGGQGATLALRVPF